MSATEAAPPPIPQAPAGATSPPEPPFFPVSTTKLAVLGVGTLGFYQFYWFYKNWQLIRGRERSDISPAGRAIFAYFFCYSLFKRLRQAAGEAGDTGGLAAGPLAAGWIILSLLWELPGFYWLIALFAPLLLLPAQGVANRVNAIKAPAHDPNDRFSAWNIVGLIAGGLGLLVLVAGTILLSAPD